MAVNGRGRVRERPLSYILRGKRTDVMKVLSVPGKPELSGLSAPNSQSLSKISSARTLFHARIDLDRAFSKKSHNGHQSDG